MPNLTVKYWRYTMGGTYIYIYTPGKNGIQYQSISDIPESLNQNHLPDNESGISPLNGEIW